jgi:hypothetical protein
MSIKSKVLAAAAALTLVGGAGLAGALATAGPAGAATPSCGNNCVNTYPQEYAGTTNNTPQFVLDVYRQGQKVDQPVILFRASNADPAEDWSYTFQGSVADFYAAGLVSSAVALHYGCVTTVTASDQIPCGTGPGAGVNDQAFEIQYSPFGVDSGLCMGVASTAFAGEGVTLQPCGVTSKTVWIQDTFSNDASPAGGYWAGINGSDTNWSNPFVLTYPGSAYPTDYISTANPHRPQLLIENLQQFTQGASPDDSNQLWTAFPGDLP